LQVNQNTKVTQIKKGKDHRCRTDKTPCRIKCPKCYLSNKRLCGSFKTPENLWRHLFQIHNFDKDSYPSISQVIEILDEISFALENKISLETVSIAVKWEMLIK